jgi:peptide/nickel transport system permease protein
MLVYIARRLVLLVVMLWLVSLLTFGIFFVLPSGDPARRFVGRESTPQSIALVKKSLGLDQPIYEQYARFAKGMVPLPGMFLDEKVYYSYNDSVPVKEEILRRFPVTAALVTGAAVLWVSISLLIGLLSARRPGGRFDRFTQGLGLLFVSIPTFVTGYLLLYLLWFKAGILPGTGIPPNEDIWTSILKGRLVLGSICLSLLFIALYARTTRRNVLEMLRSDSTRTARAQGLPERVVVGKHALRGALVPLVTMFGLDFGALLGGTVTIETIFNLPGLGAYALEAVLNADIPAVMGTAVFTSAITLFVALIVDVLYAYLDPRIRVT